MPGILERKPELPESLVVWFNAFQTASAARGFTIAATMDKAIRLPLALTVAEILTVADAYGLPRLEFLSIAQMLDAVYLAAETARQ